jgi:uridine kinase
MMAKHISINLAEKSAQHMLDLQALAEDCDIENPLPLNVILLEQANQLRGMITIIQDRNSERGDFIFYLERISSIVLERYHS